MTHLEPENDADICLKALKFDNLSAEEFDCTWKACCQSRLQYIKNNNTNDIFEKWPFYKRPSGYRLIDMDFVQAFNKGNTLIEIWEKTYKAILSFLFMENHVKDRSVKKIINMLNDKLFESENGRDAALIWALHGYFAPRTKIIKIDPLTGKKVTTKFTIIDSQESVIFLGETQQSIEDHIDHLKKTNPTIQPSIFCVGKDIFSVTNIFLYVEGIRYQFKSILKALDICFKTIYLFDFQFPEQSNMFYTFLERFFYNFKGTKNYTKVHILLEYLENNSI